MFGDTAHKMTLEKYKGLFDTLYAPLCGFANTYLNNLDASKDIVQEVFIKIWEDKIVYKNQMALKSFLYTAVRNRSINYLKDKRYRTTDNYTASQIEKLETETFFLSEVFFVETSTIIQNAIGKLPANCAQIIRLGMKEYSNAEIADELSISVNTVKTQKKIAYKKLRASLSFLNTLFTFF